MHVSICIPTFKRSEVLLNTLKQFYDQRHPALIEVIVVDQTPKELISPFFKKALTEMEREGLVRYYWREEENANGARNEAIKKARGDIIIFIDDDVLLCPKFVEAHFNNYLRTIDGKEVIAVAGECYHRDLKSGIPDNKLTLSRPNYGTRRHFLRFNSFHLRLEGEVLIGANMSFLRKNALCIRGFDENFKSYGDDGDFSKRLEQAFTDKLMVYDPEAYVIHLRVPVGGHKLIRKGHNKKEIDIVLSQLLYYLRHYTGLSLYKALLKSLRIGPLRKENVLRFWRQPYAWFIFFKAFAKAMRIKNVVKSQFT